MILLIVGIYDVSIHYSITYSDGIYILLCAFAVLVSLLLGYIGISPLKRGRGIGGMFLLLSAAASIAAIVIAPGIGWMTAFYFPLLLAGGIIALARRRSAERKYKAFNQNQ